MAGPSATESELKKQVSEIKDQLAKQEEHIKSLEAAVGCNGLAHSDEVFGTGTDGKGAPRLQNNHSALRRYGRKLAKARNTFFLSLPMASSQESDLSNQLAEMKQQLAKQQEHIKGLEARARFPKPSRMFSNDTITTAASDMSLKSKVSSASKESSLSPRVASVKSFMSDLASDMMDPSSRAAVATAHRGVPDQRTKERPRKQEYVISTSTLGRL
jgi:uncharacterized coiled-coil protein SlyX